MLFLKIFNKKKQFVFILTTLALILSLIIQSKCYIKNDLISKVSEKYVNREIYVCNNENSSESKLKQIKYVKNVEYIAEPRTIMYDNQKFILDFSLKNHTPNIISGKNVSNTKNEIIIPENIIKIFGVREKNKILNKRIGFQYFDSNGELHSINFKIVGIYSSEKTNKIFASNNTILEFNENNNKFLVEVDKYKNVDYVVNKFKQNGYIANLYNTSNNEDLNIYQSLNNVFEKFIYICFAIGVILIYYYINSFFCDEIYTISLMKAVGYKNKYLSIQTFIFITTLCIIGFIFNLIIIFFIRLLLFIIFNLNLNFIYELYVLLLLFVCSIIISIFNNYKIKKINIIKIIKSS